MSFSWSELRRRKVVRVAITYVIAAWLLLQVGDTLFGLLEFPRWAGKALVAALFAGFPLVLGLAWVFDITPEGILRTESGDSDSAQRFDFAELGTIEIGCLDLGRPQLIPLVGRHEELGILADRLETAIGGKGGIVLIGGEPGAGKTRLGEEALEMGLQHGMLPLVGHAYEDRGAPLITTTEILEDVARALPQETLRNALGDTAPEIARLLPNLRRSFPQIQEPVELPPEQQQRYLFNAILEFMQRLSRACPLVMLLDDMHWADESSILLLEHLAPHLPRMPVLLVFTYRDVAADMGEPFKRALAQLSRQEFAKRIRLRQLDHAEVASMLQSFAGSPAPDEVVDVIHRDTGGNAFFVKSVYQHLAEEGLLLDAEGAWLNDIDVNRLAVPEGVRLVIERRLQRLGETVVKMLSYAAVMGLRFDLAVLEKAFSESSADEVLDAIEASESSGMIFAIINNRNARYEFAHALVRQALLDGLTAARRQRIHLQIATTMEGLFGDSGAKAADIARHLFRAGTAADTGKTRHFLELAGEHALAAAAADEAIEAFSQALELETDSVRRAHLLDQRGTAYRTLGNWDKAVEDWLEALPEFERHHESQRVAKICWNIAYKYSWSNEMQKAESMARRGLEAVGPAPSGARCQLLATLGMSVGERKNYELWRDAVEEAAAMAEQIGEERLLSADVLMGKQYLGEHWLKGSMHAETADRALEMVRRVGSSQDVTNVLGASFIGYMNNGRFDDVEANFEEAIGLARKHGDFGTEGHAAITFGLVQCYRGHLATGSEFLEERSDWSRAVDFAWKGPILQLLGMARFWSGDWDAARQIADEICMEPIEGTMAGIEPAFRLLLLAYMNDPEAGALMEQLRPRMCIAGQENQIGAWYTGIAILEAAAVLGLREQCAALRPCAIQLSEAGTHVVWNLGLAQRHAGVAAAAAGDWDGAEEHFDAARTQAMDIGYRMELAELLRWRAQMLLWRAENGDTEKARALLDEAHAAYDDIGMKRHSRIAESLRAT